MSSSALNNFKASVCLTSGMFGSEKPILVHFHPLAWLTMFTSRMEGSFLQPDIDCFSIQPITLRILCHKVHRLFLEGVCVNEECLWLPEWMPLHLLMCVCGPVHMWRACVVACNCVHMLEGSCPQDLSFTETTAAAPFRERERGKACFHCPLPWTLDHF